MPSSEGAKQRGFTVMLLWGPGQRARRVHISRKLVLTALMGWLIALIAAGWVGFESASSDRPHESPQGGSRLAKTEPALPTSRHE